MGDGIDLPECYASVYRVLFSPPVASVSTLTLGVTLKALPISVLLTRSNPVESRWNLCHRYINY
jgi:hypothetical protein